MPNDYAHVLSMALDLDHNFLIKEGIDFCYTFKRGEVHILCQQAHQERIVLVAEKHGVEVKGYHVYE